MIVSLLFVFLPSLVVSSTSDVCLKAKDSGPCRNFVVKWYFNRDVGHCTRFWYGGCQGNENRFETQDECSRTCTIDDQANDPCNPSPCGPYTVCAAVQGQAVCSCPPQYVVVGNPSTCRPECITNSDCSRYQWCMNQKCVDPCINRCASNAVCHVAHYDHNVTCTCLDGYTGDPYTSCNKITPVVTDPCLPSPCGPYSACQNVGGYASCSCLSEYGYTGVPPNCAPECTSNADCHSEKTCESGKCKDLCSITLCDSHSRCRTRDHVPICTCENGYVSDPTNKGRCRPKPMERPVIGPNCSDNSLYADCKLITQGNYCTNQYYAKFCCRSCTLAGQAPFLGERGLNSSSVVSDHT